MGELCNGRNIKSSMSKLRSIYCMAQNPNHVVGIVIHHDTTMVTLVESFIVACSPIRSCLCSCIIALWNHTNAAPLVIKNLHGAPLSLPHLALYLPADYLWFVTVSGPPWSYIHYSQSYVSTVVWFVRKPIRCVACFEKGRNRTGTQQGSMRLRETIYPFTHFLSACPLSVNVLTFLYRTDPMLFYAECGTCTCKFTCESLMPTHTMQLFNTNCSADRKAFCVLLVT